MRFAPTKISVAVLAAALALSACSKPPAAKRADVAADAAFFAKNAKAPGVVTLPSGVQYKVEKAGPADGVSPKTSDQVKVQYEGRLMNGQVFDSSYERGAPAVFGLEGVIPGWREALTHMKVGDVWTIYIPAPLAYGDQGGGPIPPNSALTFKVELLGVAPQ